MIQSLQIENFQSHENSTVEFSPHLTAIVGLNNHGKSAVLKALQKAIRNEPEGNVFIRDGEKECNILVTTESGTVLRKVRNDNASQANMYVVNDVEFAKFGKSGIPDEVLDVLQTSPIQDFGDISFDLNFQNQLDSLFLVQGTGLPSIRGKILGKVTGIDTIGRAVQLCSGEEKKVQQNLKKASTDIVQTEQALEKYVNLDEVGRMFTDLNTAVKEFELKQSRIESIQRSLDSIREVTQKAKELRKTQKVLSQTDFGDALQEIVTLQQQCRVLASLDAIVERMKIPWKFEDVVLPDTEILQSFVDRISVVDSAYNACILLEKQVERKARELEDSAKLFTIMNTELETMKKDLGICPLCGKDF